MKKLVAIFSILMLAAFVAKGASVTLAWDGNCSTEVTGYKCYYGLTTSDARTNIVQAYVNDCGVSVPASTNVYWGSYTNSVQVSGRTNTTCVVSNLLAGVTYSFVVVSRNDAGLESDYSNGITYTVPNVVTNLPPSKVENFRVISVN
jgi:hypothetical protein